MSQRPAELDSQLLPGSSGLKPLPVQMRTVWWPCSWMALVLRGRPSTRGQIHLNINVVVVKAEDQQMFECLRCKCSRYSSWRGKHCHLETARNSVDVLSQSLLGQKDQKKKRHVTDGHYYKKKCQTVAEDVILTTIGFESEEQLLKNGLSLHIPVVW